ncbi:hypothetical protein AA957_28555 [Pseudomonas trivialis]|uniref:Sensory/regulatory protein RpfC n=1 Tax=Pseudomonas trivialis TaxID=200450 RepID=A0A0H5AFK6_9PSED|nr:hypothetical protein AA957_28555 [Pseudomonas trivialis]
MEDYFQLVQRQLQLRSERVPAENLDELMSLVKKGQIDIIPGMLPTEERKRWLSFSKPYTRFPLVIITRQDTINVDSLLSLGKARVAISENAEPIPAILKENPEITLIHATSVAEGLKMLASHDVDAYVGNLVVSDRIINDNYVGILKVAAPTGQYVELSIAVASKYSYLIPLIDRALDNISSSRREQIRATWLPIRHDSEINWDAVLKRILPAIIFLTIVIVIILVAYLRLRREIHERVKAQRNLANQLSFQSALLETIPFPVLGKDSAGRYIAVNSAYEEQFGGNRSEMLGRKPEDIGYMDAIAALEQAPSSRKAVSEGLTLHQTLYFFDKQGNNREGLLWLKPFRDEEGNIGGSVLALVDVSEIRSSEAKARASEALLTDVTESLPVTVFQCRLAANGDMHFSYVAGAPGLTFGLSADSMVRDHESFYSLIHTEDRPAVQSSFEQMVATLTPYKIEFRMYVKNSLRWVRASTGTGSREESGVVRWGGYFEDITEAREYKQELQKAKDYAEAATKTKSEFLAMMSHEIRTPVHGVIGWLEILERTSLNIRQQQMLCTIQSSANFLLQVVDDILDYSKLEAGQIKIEATHTDMRVLLDNILDAISSQAIKKNLDLHLYLDQHLAHGLLCDPYRVRQVLLNLLSNSLKFTERGKITLRLDVLHDTEKEQQISISVSDTGIGISENLQAQLFKPFQQAETSTTRRFGGTGLGLSISHGLANRMGGGLSMHSTPSIGTTVIFNVSLQKSPTPTSLHTYKGTVAVILCENPLLADALQANLMTLKMTVLRVSELAQLEYLKVHADLCFIEEAVIPPSWVPPTGNTTKLISLIRRTDVNVDLDWEKSEKLRSNPLSWESLIKLCDFYLNPGHDTDGTLNEQKPKVPAPLVSREQALSNGRLVLVAEDHPVSRDLIRRQLELLGFACDTAVDGREALDAIEKNSYGLVIADYHMPYIDGLELSRKVREAEIKEDRPRLPIIALTASALLGQEEECVDSGIDAYLRKPLKLDELNVVLKRIFTSNTIKNDDDTPYVSTCIGRSEEIDLEYVKEVYGSSERVHKVLLAVAENLQDELSTLDKLVDRSQQAKLIHRMGSGFGIVKALPLLQLASELEINLQQSDADVDRDMSYFKERIRLLLEHLERDLIQNRTD